MSDGTIGSAFIQLIPSAKGIGAAIGSELGGSEVAGAATQAGEKAGSSLSGGLVKGATVAAAGVAVIGTAAIGVGAGFLKLGATFDDAFDSIQVKTGASGAALDGLKGDFKAVFGSVPTDADAASTAIGKINQTLGLTGQPLQGLSKQFLEMSRITGTDLSGNIDAVTTVFKNFGISAEDQGGKLDDLFRVSQHTGVGVSDLASQMASGGVVLREAGLSFDESAVFLGTLAKQGLSASDVMPTLSKGLAAAAKEGKSAKDVLADTFNAIKNAPNDIAAGSIALDVFGAKAGPKMAAAIREGKVSLTDLDASMATTGDGILATANSTADFPEKFKVAMNKAKVALEPLATKVFSFVGDMAESFGNVLPGIMDKVGGVFSKVATVVGPILSSIGDAIKLVIGSFSGAGADIGKESNGFINFFVDLGATARDTIDKIVTVIKSIDFTALAKGIGDFLAPLLPAIKDLVSNGFNLIITVVTTVIQLFKDNQATIETIANILRGALLGAITAVSDVFGFLADHMGLVKAIIIPLMAAFAAYEVVVGVISIATTVWTAAQAALNIVMALNPIGLVVAAIALLVAGVIYAYTHFEGFRNVVDTVWQVLVTAFNWVKDNWPLILAILTGPIGVAVLEIAKHWDTIKEGVSAMVDAVFNFIGNMIGFFVALPGRILDAIGGLGSLLVGKGIELIQGFIEGYIGIWSTVISFYISIPGRILDFIGSVGGLLVGKGVDTIQGLISGISSMLGGIASIIGSIGGSVISWIGAAGSWLVGAGGEVIQGFISGITSWIGSIAGHISGIGNTVRSALGDASSWLYNAGQQLIQGLINGIKGMVGAAASAAADAAKAAVDAAKSFLHIGSPSKVFHEIGLNVGQGFVNGMDASQPLVTDSADSLANAAIMAASSPLTLGSVGLPGPGALVGAAAPSGAASGLSGASYEINQVFNNANVDAREVSRELSWALLTRGR